MTCYTRIEIVKIPESMKEELQSWNDGQGVDLETWTQCSGSFSLAVGYADLFCPEFVEFEGYIFMAEEICEQTKRNIRGFESGENSTSQSVENVINHFHITDLQYRHCEDLTLDKILILGEKLKAIYEARLSYLFPDKPCIVEFYKPDDPDNLEEYQLSFWQVKHDNVNV